MIELRDVTKHYGRTVALNGISIRVAAGELCVLIGPSGYGKSTTLRLVNRLVEPSSGEVFLNGQPVRSFVPENLRRGIGYVIQSIGLLPHMTVEQNIGIVPRLLGWDTVRRFIGPILGLALLVWLCIPSATQAPLEFIFPDAPEVVYDRASLVSLIGEHLVLVSVSTTAAAVLGLLIGIGVTRQAGRPFLPLAQDATSLAQTFPPVAVLALAVPILGFGFTPTVVALFVYSVLPVVKNTIAGLEAVPADILEASTGMGMRPVDRLVRTELPLAARVILAGVRTSVVLNVGTATIGAGGLGRIIIAGLVRDNPAWIITGALAAAALALLADWLFARLDETFYSAGEVI